MNKESNKNTKEKKPLKKQSNKETSKDWYFKPATKEEMAKLPIPR